jgi:bacterioferritin-associated ferredoxin
MYVCVCNGVTDRQVREAAENGCRSVAELTMRTGAGATCGTCLDLAAEILDDVHAKREFPVPVFGLACAA